MATTRWGCDDARSAGTLHRQRDLGVIVELAERRDELQLSFARAYAFAARSDEALATLEGPLTLVRVTRVEGWIWPAKL